MHNPDHLAKTWHTLTKLLTGAAGRARLWLLPATLLALALCLGALPPSSAVQAQDTGTGAGKSALVSYQLIVPPDMARLCVGETKNTSFTVVARILVPGGSTLGAITSYRVRLSAASDNPGVLSVREAEAETPLLNELSTFEYVFSGIAAGSASVTIDAVVEGNSLHESLPIQVDPCQSYTVDVNSSWVASILNTNVFVTVTIHAVLTPDANGVFTDQPNVHWEATVNRFRGCLVSHETEDTLRGNGGSIQGKITDDALSLTIAIRELDRGDYLLGCPQPPFTRRPAFNDCSIHPDGFCPLPWPFPLPFTPEAITVRIPLHGGTVTVPQHMTYLPGSADGHMTVTLTPTGIVNAGNPPGIMVQGNGTLIANGDTTPSVTDATDFGAISLGTPVSHIFTIYAGSADLTLGDVTVPDGFTLTLAPGSPVAALNSTIFTVQCDATSVGTFSGTVSIANSDTSPNPYTFAVACQVNGVPHMVVIPSIVNAPSLAPNIASGDTTPSVSDGTDFGSTTVGTPVVGPYWYILNSTGSAALRLGTISLPAGFSLIQAPPSVVQTNESSPFIVQCDAASAGTFSGIISIPTNDPTQNPFTFAITCQVTAPQMAVQGNGVSIASGDTTPSVSDGTDFSPITVGSPVGHTFIIRNTGTAELNLGAINVPAGFSFVSLRDVHVPPADSSSLTVHCDATAAGTYSGIVSIASNDPMQNPYTFTVTCQVSGVPQMAVQGNSISIASGDTTPSVSDGTDFGTTLVGAQIIHTFYIFNMGIADLTLGTISLPAGFVLNGRPLSLVPPGNSTFFDVKCNAVSAGTYSGTVVIPNNGNQANPYTFTVTCQVNAGVPQIAVRGRNAISIANGDTTPSASDGTDFGATPDARVLHRFVIANIGSADLTLGTISVPAGFVVSFAPFSPVPPGNSATLDLQCDAVSAGTYSGTVVIPNNDSQANPYTFAITCQVNATTTQMQVRGSNLIALIASGDTTPSASDGTDFGSTPVGTQVHHTFIIVNTGNAELTLGAISVPAGFSILHAPLPLVPLGGSTSLSLQCDATSGGTFSGIVSIANNDPTQNPYTFTITCQVSGGPQMDVRGEAILIASGDTTPSVSDGTDFGTRLVGSHAGHSFEIRNRGNGDLTLEAISVPIGFSVLLQPVSPVPPGHDTIFVVQCTATAAGTYSGSISIPSNDPAHNPYTFAITCQVNVPVPQMDVRGEAILIANGDTTPSVSDGTDFGTRLVGSHAGHSFEIRNRGNGDLTLEAISVPIGFSVLLQPVSPVPPGHDTIFVVQCTATAAGTYSGSVSIPNNDPTQNPYTFAVTCQVSGAPEMDVRGSTNSITSGDLTPSFADGTRYPTTTVGTPVIQTFAIVNTGTADLTLGTISVPAGFSLTRAPGTPVTAGSFTTFDLQCDAASAGTYSGSVSIANNDGNENPYTFTVTCQVNSHSIGNGANS